MTISQQPLKHPRTETLRREEGGAWKEGGETKKEGGGTEREGAVEMTNTNKGVCSGELGMIKSGGKVLVLCCVVIGTQT